MGNANRFLHSEIPSLPLENEGLRLDIKSYLLKGENAFAESDENRNFLPRKKYRDFADGPVMKILQSQCRGPEFDPLVRELDPAGFI